MNPARLWRYDMNQLSAWLPALLMLVFALGTWWLVRNAPKFAAADAEQVVSKEPDYFMREFSVRSFDPTGRLKSELIGAEGHHYPATDTLEVQQPRIRSYDEQGHPTVATAQRAVSNGDGSEVQLYGNARVVRDAVARVRADLPGEVALDRVGRRVERPGGVQDSRADAVGEVGEHRVVSLDGERDPHEAQRCRREEQRPDR